MSERKKRKVRKVSGTLKYIGDETIVCFVSQNGVMQTCLKLIKDIIIGEGYKKSTLFQNETALDLDEYECKKQSDSTRDDTVDFVVGLEKDYLLLVEAKFKVVNVKNIRNLSDKIKHSRQLLQSEDTFVHVVESVVVLLSDDNFQQQSNRLRRMMIPKYREIMPMKVEAFYSTYFH